jgi:neural cell adhesion molecule
LKIAINYRPVCVAPTIQKKENGIDLICQVDSKPKSMTYRWLFNSTDTTFEIPSAESTMFFNNYKSSTDEDHGQVLCWASNSLGEQVNPCVFHVVPLSSPQSPKNCKVNKLVTIFLGPDFFQILDKKSITEKAEYFGIILGAVLKFLRH